MTKSGKNRVINLQHPNTDEETFENIYQQLLADIEEYRTKARDVYGFYHDVGELKYEAERNHENGLEEINDDGSGWFFGW